MNESTRATESPTPATAATRFATTLALASSLLVSGCGVSLPTGSPTDPSEAADEEVSMSSTSDEVPSTATEVPATEVDTLFRSYMSGARSPRRQVIRSDAELAEAWSEITATSYPPEPHPEVDFTTTQVLIVAMGERLTGGYSIDVTDVAREGDTLYAVVEELSPGLSCGVYMAVTQPVLMVGVPLVGSAVTFVEEASVRDCS